MSSSELTARIFPLGSRAIYIGPGFNVSAHRVGVAVFCCGVTGSIQVARNPKRAAAGWVTCRTLLMPANTLHLVRFLTEPIACLYLDPQSEDVQRVAAAMVHNHKAFIADHERERDIVALYRKIVDRTIGPEDLRAQLAALLNLSSPTRYDERVTRAVARMRAAPGDAHALTALAREVGLSPSRLQHLFKTCTGVPLRRFRIWNRMGAAISAAAAGVSLTEAAYQAGFSSAAHFSSAFRAMFGLSPSELVRARLEVVAPSSQL